MNESDNLRGKVCLVTGASRTLGAVIARVLAQNGVHVAVNYWQSEEAVQQLCDALHVLGVRAAAIRANLDDPAQVVQLVDTAWETLGPLDVLVNNYGPYVDTPFLALPLADFDRVMNGNLRAAFLATQTAGQRMKARGAGCIVNIAATDAFYRDCSVYGLAKAGLIYLTEAMALELAPEVRVNVIAPDLIADNEGMSAQLVEDAVTATPMAGLVTRAEVAHAVALLCAAPIGSVTGQTIVMDGGRSIPRRKRRD
jgi:NAD(P)-dependent dehydrogenase (short-subunit alcohol dehydrogenase family)